MKLVLVEWLDAHASKGWNNFDILEQATEPLKCKSVGWLFKETKDCVIILPHVADQNSEIESQGCGDVTIPVKSITKITTLKK